MARYFCVEINGDAQNCAKLIQELRNRDWNLCVNQQGYLIVSELDWDQLEQLATSHQCELNSLGQMQQAA